MYASQIFVIESEQPCSNSLTQQEINIQNMNVELVAQMFKNYQSNVLFHLEGRSPRRQVPAGTESYMVLTLTPATDSLKEPST